MSGKRGLSLLTNVFLIGYVAQAYRPELSNGDRVLHLRNQTPLRASIQSKKATVAIFLPTQKSD